MSTYSIRINPKKNQLVPRLVNTIIMPATRIKYMAAWALLVLYLNASLQLLLPFVSDCIAHLFFWHDHLEHVHHGHVHSHHVAAEMATLAGDDGHEHPAAPHAAFLIDKDALSAHISPAFVLNAVAAPETPASVYGPWLFHYGDVCSEVLFPPPDYWV